MNSNSEIPNIGMRLEDTEIQKKKGFYPQYVQKSFSGDKGGNRTPTPLKESDFESDASTNSATLPFVALIYRKSKKSLL